MTEKAIQWTTEQDRAIRTRDRDVLVTASAGTGKTAVLSGRAVEIVADEDICPDVMGILVLTFTDMAAEEMRSRIAAQIRDRAAGDPHLRRQLVLLQGCDISTIHSFCKRLIGEFFHELALDPTFAIVDADEAELLKADTLDKTIEWAWTQEGLRQGLDALLAYRNLNGPDGFLSTIVDVSSFLDNVVSRDDFYNRAMEMLSGDPLQSELAHEQQKTLTESLRDMLDRIRGAVKLYDDKGGSGKWRQQWCESFAEPLEKCLKLAEAGRWDDAVKSLDSVETPHDNKPRDLKGPEAAVIGKIAEAIKKQFGSLGKLAILNPDYVRATRDNVALQSEVMIALVRKFNELYTAAKRGLNCLDFSDLEHYALKLLTEEASDVDNLQPSAVALALRDRYRYIFVDEYQDINPVQKAILRMLSSPGNVFFVGDVKQSIYAFRGAEPDIFVSDLQAASAESGDSAGLRVDLTTNFRSDKPILDFVNHLFSRTMTSDLSAVGYDESAHLKPAAAEDSTQPLASPAVELHILDESVPEVSEDDDQEESAETDEYGAVTARQRQAALIAQRIRQLVGADAGEPEMQVFDKQQGLSRNVEYRDIVILMRSLAKKANEYVEILRLAGVPVSSEAAAGYFEATEITDMLSLLKVLDNPRRDIELAAVLRSPLFNFTDTDLARIKLHAHTENQSDSSDPASPPVADFYDAVTLYASSGPQTDLSAALNEALDRLEQWRTLARRGSIADLIWLIYRQSRYLALVTALPNGQARRANLLKLHDRAIQFEGFAANSSIPSLSRFVEFVEKLRETGRDWAPAEPEAATGNAVRILSVHKSKGLEFPVVILAELETLFNTSDIRKDCLTDSEMTIGMRIIEKKSATKLTTLAHQVIAERKRRRSLAEEMRILYVATTRAKTRLIMTASSKASKVSGTIAEGLLSGATIEPWLLKDSRNALKWILLGLSDQKPLQQQFGDPEHPNVRDDALISVARYTPDDVKRLSDHIENLKKAKSSRKPALPKPTAAAGRLLKAIKQSLDWRYDFTDATELPAKQSVSDLTHAADEFATPDHSGALLRKPACLAGQAESSRPPANLVGTAAHLVISTLDLKSPVTADAVCLTVEQLTDSGAISESVARCIDSEAIAAFFADDPGAAAIDPANRTHREWPFTCTLPPQCLNTGDSPQHSKDNTHDDPIVQGVIDMLIETPSGLLVIDFKTDSITARQAPERAERYRKQLDLYAEAASRILKAPIAARYLHFLSPGLSWCIE